MENTIVRCIAYVLIALVLAASGCTGYQNKLIADMVISGADPVAASCALTGLSGDAGRAVICARK